MCIGDGNNGTLVGFFFAKFFLRQLLLLTLHSSFSHAVQHDTYRVIRDTPDRYGGKDRKQLVCDVKTEVLLRILLVQPPLTRRSLDNIN